MSMEVVTGFAPLGVLTSVIITMAILAFLFALFKMIAEDVIDSRRNKKHVRKVVFCKDCKYYELEFDKSFCQKWQSDTASRVFCSRGESKEGER